MQIRKFRWSKVYESAEEELLELLEHKQIVANRWMLDDGEILDKTYEVDTQLWCAEGQLTCAIEGKTYSVQPGDAMNIPAKTSCSMRASFGGCACYESAVKSSL